MGRNQERPRKQISLPVSTSCFVEGVHNYCLDVATRQIWVHGVDMNTDGYEGSEPGVEYMMATRFIKNLHILRKQSATEPITIHLHTCGGIFEEGMAMYDAIMLMPYGVTIISYTHARSMSSIIFQAGDKRLMMPHSYFLFHQGTICVDGEVRTVKSIMAYSDLQNEIMMGIYVENARKGPKFKGWSKSRIRQFLEREMERKSDVFLTPQQAIDYGLADGILTKWPN